MQWSRNFDDPITLPDGRVVLTLRDAAHHIQTLEPAEHRHAHWQLAIETLINCAEGRDFVMHARIAVLRALNAGKPDPATAPRKKRAKKYRVISDR